MKRAKLRVEGMHCASCALNIDDSLEALAGVRKASTSFPRRRTKVEYDETQVDIETLRSAIAGLGYEAQPH